MDRKDAESDGQEAQIRELETRRVEGLGAGPQRDQGSDAETVEELGLEAQGQKEMDPEKAELKFHAEIVMKPKSGKSASNGNFQIGSHKGNVSSAIDKPFKDIVAGKISPGKDIKVSVKLTVDESIDEGATVTVTIEDKNGKKVADKSIKLSSIAS